MNAVEAARVAIRVVKEGVAAADEPPHRSTERLTPLSISVICQHLHLL